MSARDFALLFGAAILTCAAPAWAAGDAARGAIQFQRCANCHSLAAGDNGIGPTLHGIFGSKAGAVPDYRFSKAMAESGIVWNEATLRKFLSDPGGTVPGTKMAAGAISDSAACDDLVAYLKQASR